MPHPLLPYFILVLFINIKTLAQKQLAITMDDPNTYETPIVKWEERNGKILKTLEKFNIKAALFVCGMRVNDTNGKTLLSEWDKQNHLICNHSFSHHYYHSNKIASEVFIGDFKRGDSVINSYQNYTKLFRFPYLKEGNTAAKRDAMRNTLNKEGYSNGFVTIDASDWYIDSKIIEALKQDPKADLTPYKTYYIQHILDRANYYDSLATLLFNRKIKHTLLIHHSLLNALYLEDVLSTLKENGWQLIDAKEAFKDEVFKLQPLIEPCGESIIWQCAKMNPKMTATLRYPAEDGEYEKEPLEKMVQEYKSKRK